MAFWRCAVYFAILGIASFIIGRILPKSIFKHDCFPFSSFDFEKGGKIYKKIGIAKWQSKVPDMSRIFTKIMPPKKLCGTPDKEKLMIMISETCVAEAVHFWLIIFGIGYLFIWPGTGGRICFVLSFFINMVFIVIQRYNRPRLVSVYRKKYPEEKVLCGKEQNRCVF
ncbi:MAG: glycosyl-4,4'-diaponeurosporenoate acyltransferase [Oscillospiraceae bacterium]|nr:glycosyl-4,4'-diaponeurosporenoate acyltransferase [Oscillospiraceae bacterium]MBQ3235911.1 glycosyl-4,4'-diaponeurosporenoate acyltransferase [Oscillospiraceae bacterium]MBQ4118483.1 glycosyl-4,4'-diaponeurosporenoate acyltransferase [Oscillospiraceae bacterium]